MRIEDIDPGQPLLPQIDQLPDEHHRLAYFISKELAEGYDQSDQLVQEFQRLGMKIVEPDANIPDLVRSYCEIQCTRLPIRLLQLSSGIRNDLKRSYLEDFSATTPKEDGLDNLIPDEQPHTPVARPLDKPRPPTYENMLVRLGFTRNYLVTSGLSPLLDELKRKADLLLSLNDKPDQEAKKQRLFGVLKQNYNLSELQTLCFERKFPYEDWPDDGRTSKARELTAYCERYGLLSELEEQIKQDRPQLAKTLNTPLTTLDILTDLARQTITHVVESLTLLLSFYGRWIRQWETGLINEIIQTLNDDNPNMIRLYGLIDKLNQLAQTDSTRDAFKQTFQRSEIVSLKHVLRILKQAIAYEHHYLDAKVVNDFYVAQCFEETKDLVAKASEFITYLKTGQRPEEIALANTDNFLPQPGTPIVPDVVSIQRRMTLNDGTTRVDCLHEDGETRSYRFGRLVYFYYQEESFFYVPQNSSSTDTLLPDPIIFPLKATYPMANKL